MGRKIRLSFSLGEDMSCGSRTSFVRVPPANTVVIFGEHISCQSLL